MQRGVRDKVGTGRLFFYLILITDNFQEIIRISWRSNIYIMTIEKRKIPEPLSVTSV